MWPRRVPWTALRFGVEIEFVGADPAAVPLLPGWQLAAHERQFDADGRETGGELTPPPLTWSQRGQIREMLARARAAGAHANWDCGLHVHVGLEPWGEAMVIPLLDAALATQAGLAGLLQTSEYRRLYCPPVTAAMRERYAAQPGKAAVRYAGRPAAHRCGINAAAWFDHGSVEIRYANGSLAYGPVLRTAALCLRFVAAIGAGHSLPGEAVALARVLGTPASGYPPPQAAPLWRLQQLWLEAALLPALTPLVLAGRPGAEVHHLEPGPAGITVVLEHPGNRHERLRARWQGAGWQLSEP